MATRKPAGSKKKARKPAARKAVKKAAKKPVRRASARKPALKPTKARKKAPRAKAVAKAKPKARVVAKAKPKATAKPKAKAVLKAKALPKKVARARPAVKRSAPASAKPAPKPVERKAPSLNRARRVVVDDDIVASPPSTLDMDATASAARSGGKALKGRIAAHHETSPEITAGDVDADWESAYSTGDEAPGGDNMTPDQDVVDEIGAALGVEYDDDEELKGGDEIAERDEHRWDEDD